jgi:phosphoglycerate dehydrogenase-like enzyme
MAVRARPSLVVFAPARLFASFFDAPRVRRLSRSFRWTRLPARTLTRAAGLTLRDASGLVTTWDSPSFGLDLILAAPQLRIVAHCGGEVKNRFAAPLFDRLTITNAPGPMAESVAELAVTFLLYSARDVDAYRYALRRPSNAIYTRLHRDGAGFETLLGRPVGLLGFGRIGRAIATLLRPFGAHLVVHDPHVPAAVIRAAGAQPVSFRTLLGASRQLVVAAALTEQTRHLLGADALALLPDGATVINVARGGIVDLDALTREVRRRRLRCALDVTDPAEPLPLRHPLRNAPGAILTPHVGAASRHIRLQMADTVLSDLERFFHSRPVRNRVTPAMLRRMT